MKILSASQIREADRYTIENEPISSVDLMERAATALFEYLQPRLDPRKKTAIVCGTGNNGGDGLVLARLMYEHQYSVDVFEVGLGQKSDDYKINESRLPLPLQPVGSADLITYDVIIDAIFGSGLNREVTGAPAEVITEINASPAQVISVDIPSGLFSDKPAGQGAIVRADYTLTFQVPRLVFMLPEYAIYLGEWEVLDIGLHDDYLTSVTTPDYFLDQLLITSMVHAREKFSHKGTFGRALLIAGSYGKMGAAVLAARAALRSGLGLLTVYIPRAGYSILQTAVPEAMVLVDDGDHFISGIPDGTFDVIGIGPGIGQDQQTHFALEEMLRRTDQPMVLDADALNILAVEPRFMELLPAASILTPHPGEFERLAGGWSDDFERLEKQRSYAQENNCIIVLKGAHTSIAMPDGSVYFNATGNPGMATAGSGDVLTGIITGFLSQGYSPHEAACLGVYLHGLAGDIAADELSESALIAGDLIDYLPFAMKLI